MEKIVVSLSTIPPRFQEIGESLTRILNQDLRPNEVHLYVPRTYRRFPKHAFCLPCVPEGVSIKVVDEDFGPATKVLPCAATYLGTNTRIVYCDDDRLPAKNWLRSLVIASRCRPLDVIVSSGDVLEKYGLRRSKGGREPRAVAKGRRADIQYYAKRILQIARGAASFSREAKPSRRPWKKSGYIDFAHGLGGVSIRAEFLDQEDYNIPSVIWSVDDIWLSGAFERKGIGIWADKSVPLPAAGTAADLSSLANTIIEQHNRQQADFAAIQFMREKYDIWT